MVISSSNSTEVYNNTAKKMQVMVYSTNSKFLDFKGNTIEDNDGGIKYNNCDYCNLTFNKIDDNGGYGLWFVRIR